MADVETVTLSTAHAASSYGRPVLVIDGEAYGPADVTPAGKTGAELVSEWARRFTGQGLPGPELQASSLEGIARALRELAGQLDSLSLDAPIDTVAQVLRISASELDQRAPAGAKPE